MYYLNRIAFNKNNIDLTKIKIKTVKCNKKYIYLSNGALKQHNLTYFTIIYYMLQFHQKKNIKFIIKYEFITVFKVKLFLIKTCKYIEQL